MDNNFQDYGLPKVNLNPFIAQYNLAAINKDPLVFEVTPSIEITPGFRSNNNKISWQLSIDQHTLRFYISEQLTDTGAIQYVLKLVGTLYYNVALIGLEPIDPIEDTGNLISFSSDGSHKIDYTVGTFNSIAEIQSTVLSNFSITATLNQIYGIGESSENGETIVYDHADVKAFNKLLSGNQHVTIYGKHTMIITFAEQPIS